jgi:hypothetical protein
MNSATQTWIALAVVALTVALLGWSWWRRRGQHEGCDCPGAKTERELRKLKR